MKYDYIIIGSGVSGLTCASGLSLMGKKVLVLEKNEEPGGCMKNLVWKEGDVQRGNWTLGMQFTLAYGTKTIYNKLLQIFTDDKCTFSQMDTAYQKIKFLNWGGKIGDATPPPTPYFNYNIQTDGKLMRDQLINDFPAEKRAIKRYYRNMNAVNRFAPVLTFPKFLPFGLAKFIYPIVLAIFFPVMCIRLRKFSKITLKEVIEERYKIQDPKLRLIIYSYWHFEGMAVDTIPYVFYVVATKMCEQGIFIPNGGATAIRDNYLAAMKKQGAEIRVNSEVKKIIIKNNVATGVELKDGTIIEATKIISTAGVPETISRLVEKNDWNKRITDIMSTAQKMKDYRSGVVLRVGLKGDISKLGFVNATYKTQIGESSQLIGDPTKHDWLPQDITYSFLSYIDKTANNPTYHAVDVIAWSPYSCFAWLKLGTPEYAKVEARITEILIDSFNTEYPGVKDLVAFTYLTSPLTVENQTSHIKGNIDGLNMDKCGLMNIQPRTGIKNLYFSGMDMFSQGITTFNGIITIGSSEGMIKTTWKLWRKWREIKKNRKSLSATS